MRQEEILNLLSQDNTLCDTLNSLSEVHRWTKHYLLIAEELSDDGFTFLQPLKEHRDAYEHLMRIFMLGIRENLEEDFNKSQYVTKNLEKAFGHEYRAFFDTADWLTFILRKFIRENLSSKSISKTYKSKHEDFDEVKKFINEVPLKIAKHREKKDVNNNKSLSQEVLEYKETLDKLLDIYQKVCAL